MPSKTCYFRDAKTEITLGRMIRKTGISPTVRAYRTVDSTNTRAKVFAARHKGTDAVFLAAEQTAGKGRLGRSFVSEKGVGLYISFLLSKNTLRARNAKDPLTETARAAVHAAEAIEELCPGLCPGIKWVNDLQLGGKKIAGILAEGVFSAEGELEALVIGIGVNLLSRRFEDGLADIAASIGDFTENPPERLALAAALAARFLRPDPPLFLESYRSRLLYVGREILLIPRHYAPDQAERATLLGVNEQGHLLVRTEAGEEKTVSSGEISLRPADPAENL